MKTKILMLLMLLFFLVGCDQATTAPIDTSAVQTAIELRVADDELQWKYTDETTWTSLLDLDTLVGETGTSGTPGVDGKEVSFQIAEGFIQWQYEGESTWTNLISLTSITGEAGVGIGYLEINSLGELIVSYTDATEVNLGVMFKPHLVEYKDMFGNVLSVQLVLDGEDATPPTAPLVAGYSFIGYSANSTNITSNMTIILNYQIENYTITFYPDGGSMTESLSFAYGVPITLPIPEKPGYKFLGWFAGNTANSPRVYDGKVLTNDMFLYARWQKATAISVSNEAEFMAALDDLSYQEIVFTNDIFISDYLEITRSLTIYGNGYNLISNNLYAIFTIIRPYYNYSYYEGYPDRGYLNIYDLNIISETGIEDYMIYSAIELAEVEEFDLTLSNVDISGLIESAIIIGYSSYVNVNIFDSDLQAEYIVFNLYDLQSVHLNIIDSSLMAFIPLYLANVSNSQFLMDNSFVTTNNADLEDPSSMFLLLGCSQNDFYIKNTYFNMMTLIPSPIVQSMFDDIDYQEFVFENCTFEINLPVFEELFYSDFGYTSFNLYNSTIIIKEGIEVIPSYGFADVYGVNSFILPSTLLTISNSAFYNNYDLTSIVIPDGVTSIGEDAFTGCDNLRAVVIPASVTYVGQGAMNIYNDDCIIYLMTGVDTTLWDPDWNIGGKLVIENVESVGEIDGLIYVALHDRTITIIDFIYNEVSDIVIPQEMMIEGILYTVTKIGAFAMSYNNTLTSIFIPNTVDVISEYAFSNCVALTEVTFEENSTIAIIAEGAFEDCEKLRSITIPSSVVILGDYSFYSCYSLETVTFAEGLVLGEIPMGIFAHCEKLKEITIPASVIEINSEAFSGCTSLSEVIFESNTTLEVIGDYAFQSVYGLRTIFIPSSVVSIRDNAFSYCQHLEEVIIPLDTALTYIGNSAFLNNLKLESIYLPETLTYLGVAAFSDCLSLTTVTIPASLTVLNTAVFQSCYKIETVIFAEGSAVTSIGNSAFYNNKALTSINLPDTVTSIGDSAFMYNDSLEEIALPTALTSIGSYAFYGSFSLSKVDFGNIYNLTTINGYAFQSCTSLTSFFIPSSVTYVGSSVFRYISDFTAYVEAPSLPVAWSTAWSSGVMTVVWGANYLVCEPNNGTEAITIYAAVGATIEAPEGVTLTGYVFSGWYIDEEFTTPYVFDTMPSEKITVYAKWLPII